MANNFDILRAEGERKAMTLLRRNENESDLNNQNLVYKELDLNKKKKIRSKHFFGRRIRNNDFRENFSDPSQNKEPIYDPSGMTEYYETKVDLPIKTIQKLFPNLSSEYIMKCLPHYNYSAEEVVEALTSGNLPSFLKVCDCDTDESFENSFRNLFVEPSKNCSSQLKPTVEPSKNCSSQLKTAVEPSKNCSSQLKTTVEPSKNCSLQLRKLPEIENWADEADFTEFQSMSSEEIEATVAMIEEIYPDLGRVFIMECLKFYDYSGEEVINAITFEKLPPPLEYMYKTTRAPPVNSMSTKTLGEESMERSSSQVEKDVNSVNESKKKKKKRKKSKKSKPLSEERNDIESSNDTKNVTGHEELVDPDAPDNN